MKDRKDEYKMRDNGINAVDMDAVYDQMGILSKDELKNVAVELLDSLRPRKMQIWQVKEVLRYAMEFADRERLT